MGKKIRLTSKQLSEEKLPIAAKGYDAFRVDELFDQIVKDYEVIEASVILTKEEHAALMKKIDDLNSEVLSLSIALKNEKKKTKYIDGSSTTKDNVELLKRIGKLEAIIHKKLHMTLDEINSFDPDDC